MRCDTERFDYTIRQATSREVDLRDLRHAATQETFGEQPVVGQALRGSSELHAIGDSNLYLRRLGSELLLSIEQRAAPSVDDIAVGLLGDGDALALRVMDDEQTQTEPPLRANLADQIVAALTTAGPQTPRQLRASCGVRMAKVYDALRHLADGGHVVQDRGGAYQRA